MHRLLRIVFILDAEHDLTPLPLAILLSSVKSATRDPSHKANSRQVLNQFHVLQYCRIVSTWYLSIVDLCTISSRGGKLRNSLFYIHYCTSSILPDFLLMECCSHLIHGMFLPTIF